MSSPPIAGVLAHGPAPWGVALVDLADAPAVRLAGILVPGDALLPPMPQPLRARVTDLLEQAPRPLSAARRWPDAYGQTLAVVADAGGAVLQEALLAAGLAVVWPTQDMDHRSWLALEADARSNARGLWRPGVVAGPRVGLGVGDGRFTAAAPSMPGLVLVQARVRRVSATARAVYVDLEPPAGVAASAMLSLRVPLAVATALEARGLGPLALAGQEIRVRGVPEPWQYRRADRAAPPRWRLSLSHPDQLERGPP